jgi:hypothetical protein
MIFQLENYLAISHRFVGAPAQRQAFDDNTLGF